MKILTKYITKKLFIYFFSLLFVFSIFIFVIDFFETANIMTKKNQEIPISHIIYHTFYYLHLITPLITMLSGVMLFNYFIITNEYKAIYAAGFSQKIFLYPLIIFSFLITLISLTFTDHFTTSLYRKTKSSKETLSSNIYIKKGNIIFGFSKLKNKNHFENVYIEKEDENIMIKAKEILWRNDKKIWEAKNINLIDINKTQASFLKTYEINFLPYPEDIIIDKITDANIYSIKNILQRIKKKKNLSMDITQEKNILFFKLSLIFINFPLTLISFMLSRTSLIKSKPFSFAAGIIISFLTWFLVIIFKKMGDLEIIEPEMILFLPNIFILLISFYLIWKKRFTYT